MYRHFFKRFLDILFSGLLLILLSPLLLILAIMVRVKHGAPVLFRQKRPGKDERIFEIMKFRSMTNARDAEGRLLPDKDRVTRFGLFLRTTSLDELPELWCIFKGDMSFVGPRPLPVVYLPYYTEEEAKRHLVRPGLTGPAQIGGRNALDWDERLPLDLDYVRHVSLRRDLGILWQTVMKVLRREDIVLAGTGKVGDLDEIREVQRPEYVEKVRQWMS